MSGSGRTRTPTPAKPASACLEEAATALTYDNCVSSMLFMLPAKGLNNTGLLVEDQPNGVFQINKSILIIGCFRGKSNGSLQK